MALCTNFDVLLQCAKFFMRLPQPTQVSPNIYSGRVKCMQLSVNVDDTKQSVQPHKLMLMYYCSSYKLSSSNLDNKDQNSINDCLHPPLAVTKTRTACQQIPI